MIVMIPISDPKSQLKPLQDDMLAIFTKVLNSGQYILGPHVDKLEDEIANRLGVLEAVGVASGTDALVLALEAFGIGEGDEVITTPFTFFATAEAITRVGATPVFVDVEKDTFNINPKRIEEKITPATKAILPVHIFGQPAKMDEINQIAKNYQLIVIEDACQAFGATYRGKYVGQLGDAACFSFFPTKNLSTMGDGGLITTANKKIAQKIRKLRVHGSFKRYYHDTIGYNSRLDEIHAAILRICLKYIDDWNAKRQAIAKKYDEQLKDLPHIQLPVSKIDRTHVYHLYCIATLNRQQTINHLQKNHIQTGIYYPQCLHLQKAFHHLDYSLGDFPVAERTAKQLFSIPIYPHLTPENQTFIIDTLHQYLVKSR